MTSERVRELLSEYNTNKGRKGHLSAELRRLELEYASVKAELVDAMASPRAQVISDMPRASGNGDKVGNIAVKLADGWEPDELVEIRRQQERTRTELERVVVKLSFVEAWVDALPAKEKYVMTHRYMHGELWAAVQDSVAEWMGHDITIRGLHDVRRSAMRKIYEMAADV